MMTSDDAESRPGTVIDHTFAPLAPFGPVVIRFVLAIIIFMHGIGKLFAIGPFASGIAGTAAFFDSLGIPAATLLAWVVALVEVAGPILLVVGFWTRWAAAAIVVDMMAATVIVHAPNGFAIGNNGIEFTLALAGMALAILLMGPGDVYAIERSVVEDEAEADTGDEPPGDEERPESPT